MRSPIRKPSRSVPVYRSELKFLASLKRLVPNIAPARRPAGLFPGRISRLRAGQSPRRSRSPRATASGGDPRRAQGADDKPSHSYATVQERPLPRRSYAFLNAVSYGKGQPRGADLARGGDVVIGNSPKRYLFAIGVELSIGCSRIHVARLPHRPDHREPAAVTPDRPRRARHRLEGRRFSACCLEVELLIVDVAAERIGRLRRIDAAPRCARAVDVVPAFRGRGRG